MARTGDGRYTNSRRHRRDAHFPPGRPRSRSIRTLAEAGVPLARIRDLRATRDRLRRLAAGRLAPLPEDVGSHLEQLARWGFTQAWVDLQRGLWILAFATHPDHAFTLFHDQAEMLANPALRQLFLAYDQARGLDADDPRVDDLADRIVGATLERYGPDRLPELDDGTLRDPRPHPGHGQRVVPGVATTRHSHPGPTGPMTRRRGRRE